MPPASAKRSSSAPSAPLEAACASHREFCNYGWRCCTPFLSCWYGCSDCAGHSPGSPAMAPVRSVLWSHRRPGARFISSGIRRPVRSSAGCSPLGHLAALSPRRLRLQAPLPRRAYPTPCGRISRRLRTPSTRTLWGVSRRLCAGRVHRRRPSPHGALCFGKVWRSTQRNRTGYSMDSLRRWSGVAPGRLVHRPATSLLPRRRSGRREPR